MTDNKYVLISQAPRNARTTTLLASIIMLVACGHTSSGDSDGSKDSGPTCDVTSVCDAGLTDAEEPSCVDNDNDGYGANCAPGVDCNDEDDTIWDNCPGWQEVRDFESGTAGTLSEGPDAFDSHKDGSTYTVEQAESGTQSAMCTIADDSTGWGDWGGKFSLPAGESVGVGDEFWYKVAVWYPSNFDFSGSSSWIKGQRIRKTEGDAHDTAFCGNGITCEGSSSWTLVPRSQWSCVGGAFPREQWVTVETYVKFSNIAGEGVHRVWRDGVLIFEQTVEATAKSTSDKISDLLLWTQWNGTPDGAQRAYVDNVVYGTRTPDKFDAAGNRMIGPTNWVSP